MNSEKFKQLKLDKDLEDNKYFRVVDGDDPQPPEAIVHVAEHFDYAFAKAKEAGVSIDIRLGPIIYALTPKMLRYTIIEPKNETTTPDCG